MAHAAQTDDDILREWSTGAGLLKACEGLLPARDLQRLAHRLDKVDLSDAAQHSHSVAAAHWVGHTLPMLLLQDPSPAEKGWLRTAPPITTTQDIILRTPILARLAMHAESDISRILLSRYPDRDIPHDDFQVAEWQAQAALPRRLWDALIDTTLSGPDIAGVGNACVAAEKAAVRLYMLAVIEDPTRKQAIDTAIRESLYTLLHTVTEPVSRST